jgi:hypothetical protein
MQVTSLLKQRFASSTTIRQSFELSLEQTFKFPFRKPEALARMADVNVEAVRDLIKVLGAASRDGFGAIWRGASVQAVMEFLRSYEQDDATRSISIPLILRYIEECVADGELTSWTIAIRGRKSTDNALGTANWGSKAGKVNQISRTRLKGTESLGVITGPGDEGVALSPELRSEADRRVEQAEREGRRIALNAISRELRSPSDGLLLLYPISKRSGNASTDSKTRQALFDDPNDSLARDLVGIALSFPRSDREREIEAFLTGTVGWRPVAE